MKKILFIGGTHGNEPIGVNVLLRLSNTHDTFDWLIGNPRAFEQGTREFEGDLNRSAPGDVNSPQYASRRAAEIITRAQDYQYTIDLHGATEPTGIFLIITNPCAENFALAARLNVQRIVVWPSFSAELKGPLSEFVPCGLEIECGNKNAPETEQALTKILTEFLASDVSAPIDWRTTLATREIYEVHGSLRDTPQQQLTEFGSVTINNESFVSLFVGTYQPTTGVVCYKLRRYTGDFS
ncbi:MAG: hypothetical protein A3C15_00550 [Candidatus Magasanikbacteria bacterium RIFCSPHIGHO2_02_FULL_50_9b]|uniref:Succinylglutamate desuccinylase/Aspartoacylase catalytic domain-containing protein n=1 Tax=Candidatus Magasanikbacteria bacterium RIFCSPHIGHO2_02_FULL_50_9b TaxID=1798682 RepID=A0A1F6M8Y0_9BACT|nr:MAG: hypothetical protein A3C15_00550 [Candidatus Magasanikbacteria bacterium RIFCSPHIGHO2_02_FULL_50_9b]